MKMVKCAVQNGPHLRGKRSTFKMMMEFFIVVLVLFVASIISYACMPVYTGEGSGGILINYYSWYYALKVLGMGVTAMLFSVIADAIFYLPYFWIDEKRVNLEKGQTRLNKYLKKLIFNYSYVTGLILALLFPVGTPIWVIICTSFISTFIVKNLFGGFGANVFNPAIVGRVIAQVAFASQLKCYLGEPNANLDNILAGASQTPGFAGDATIGAGSSISTTTLFIGNYLGTIGETLAIVIIILAVYLMVREIIDFRVFVSFVVTFFLAYLIMNLAAGKSYYSFEYAFRQLCVGGALFGATFCLTDPVTSPVSRTGKIIFATGSALITFIIRAFASAPEGMAYSILVMNMLTPLIDYVISDRTNQVMWKKYTAISIIPAATLILGATWGVTHYDPIVVVNTDVKTEKISVDTYSTGTTYGKFIMDVTVGYDFKVYAVEIGKGSNTIDGNWTAGGIHDIEGWKTDLNFDKFSQTYVPTADKPIDFSVYENANDKSEGIVTGATEATYGYVKTVKKAIEQFKSTFTVKHGVSTEPGAMGMGAMEGDVYMKDNKVYRVENITGDFTLPSGWWNGGMHDFGQGEKNFDNFYAKFVGAGAGIDFSVFQNCSKDDPAIKNGASESTYGYVSMVLNAINQVNA